MTLAFPQLQFAIVYADVSLVSISALIMGVGWNFFVGNRTIAIIYFWGFLKLFIQDLSQRLMDR